MLETLSYIVVIVGTPIGIYYAWKNDHLTAFMPSSKRMDAILEKRESGREKSEAIESFVAEIDTFKQLKFAFRSTQKMHFAKPYDDALKEIVKKACEMNALDFALKVASKAHFALALDEMLLLIVDRACQLNDLKIADKASNSMYYAKNVDEGKKRLIDSIGSKTKRVEPHDVVKECTAPATTSLHVVPL